MSEWAQQDGAPEAGDFHPNAATMRVAHCLHTLDLGGAQRVVTSIVRDSQRRSVRPYVYSAFDGVFSGELAAAGATVRIIPRRLPKLDPFWIAALARAMRADGIELVHTHLFGDSLHGYLGAKLAGNLPVIMTLHIGTEGLTGVQRLGYRWLLRRSTRTIACTESARRSFGALAGGALRIDTIPNGIAVPSLHPVDVGHCETLRARLGIPRGARVIGAVGRMAEQKGFADLIEAVAHLGAAGAPAPWLVLVGDGPLLDALRARACEAGVGGRVVFAGYRSDVSDLLRVFDVIVFSSLYEGLSIALLEAMAAACCIVATDAPGITDAVADEREALLVPRHDPLRLSGALQRVLGDVPLRRRLGAAARQRFREGFTADKMVAEYFRIYEEVYRQARVGRPAVMEA